MKGWGDPTNKRYRAHHHNQKRGWVRMMQMQLVGIKHSDTATDEAKQLAHQMHLLSVQLATALNTRVDPECPKPLTSTPVPTLSAS